MHGKRAGSASRSDGPRARASIRKAGKTAACVVIISAAAVTLGLSVNHDIQITAQYTKPQWARTVGTYYRQEQCFYRAIRSVVPDGARVYVDSPQVGHAQLLAELSTLWAVPQKNRANAQWQLAIRSASRWRHVKASARRGVTAFYCFGAVLTARHI